MRDVPWACWMLANLGLAAAICVAIWVTKSALPLFGFLLSFGIKRSPSTCSRCGAALGKDDES